MSEPQSTIETITEAAEEALSPGSPQAHLVVEDLHDQYKHFLTPDADRALDKYLPYVGLDTLAAKLADGLFASGAPTHAIFLSCTIKRREDVAPAAEALYNVVNDLAAKGVLRGNLCKLSSIELAYKELNLKTLQLEKVREPRWALFAFPHVSNDFTETVPYQTPEGSCGVAFELPEVKP